MGATNPRWKKFERDLARDVGTERVPVTGERDGADFLTPMFVYSAKFRKAGVPAELSDWLDRVQAKGRFDGKIGVLVVRRHRRARVQAAVLLTWGDWLQLHGNLRRAPIGEEALPDPDAYECQARIGESREVVLVLDSARGFKPGQSVTVTVRPAEVLLHPRPT